MRKIVLLSLCIFALFSSAVSQSDNAKFKVFVFQGDSAANLGNYYGAHIAYRSALNLKEDLITSYKAAEVCRAYQNYTAAANFYKSVLAQDSSAFPIAQYRYAEMLKFEGKYNEAAKQFKKYYEEHKKDYDYFSKRAKHEAVNCKDSVATVDTVKKRIRGFREKQPMQVNRLENKSINTEYAELGSFEYSKEEIFFASCREDEKDSNKYYTQLYRARKYDGMWQKATALPKDINEDETNVANLTFDETGKKAFFSKCVQGKNYECAIYAASYNAGEFSNVRRLPEPINKSGSNNTQPCYVSTKMGDYLFFSSDRNGGYGMLDIWYAKILKNGAFGAPQNCGPAINTFGDEITPYYDDKDSTLYFSSELHNSLGGFDIFKSKGEIRFNKWARAKNIGYPINSSHNETYYIHGDSLNAYFTSNREGATRFAEDAYANDIYYFERSAKDIIISIVPFSMFFDNDQPNPNSWLTRTQYTYGELVDNYLSKKNEYMTEYASTIQGETPLETQAQRKYYSTILDSLFEVEIKQGAEKLELFIKLLDLILQSGEDVVVMFKGYTSPAGKLDYNDSLARRRISCVVNSFNEYKGGKLMKYLEMEPNTGRGSMRYIEVPIGVVKQEGLLLVEGQAINVEELQNKQNTKAQIYSPAALLQRKIEILAVKFDEKENLEKERERVKQLKVTEEEQNESGTENSSGGFQKPGASLDGGSQIKMQVPVEGALEEGVQDLNVETEEVQKNDDTSTDEIEENIEKMQEKMEREE